MATTLPNDPSQPYTVRFAWQSPQVFTHRVFMRTPGGAYQPLPLGCDPTTETPTEIVVGPCATNTEISYVIAVVALSPHTPYRLTVTFSQGGVIPEGGTIHHEGTTGSATNADVRGRVLLA